MNKVIFLGRLVDNPRFTILPNETKLLSFRLAVSSSRDDKTLFINVVTFGKLAEQCQKMLQKATKVLIDGRLECRKDNETNLEYYSVVANEVKFLTGLKPKEVKDAPVDNEVSQQDLA